MKVDGECHCGAIAYTAEVNPDKVTICHCTDCQVLSGGPYIATVPAVNDSFKVLRGELHTYLKKTSASGRIRAHGLCANCGTRLYAANPEAPHNHSLRTGPLKQRAHLKPTRQIWCMSAQPWAMDLEASVTDKIPGQ